MLDMYYVYNLNAIFSIIVLAKCYIILRVYAYFSRWTDDTANSLARKYKARGGIHFAIKAELKKRPYTMLTIMMVITMILCAFALRTFEYGVYGKESQNLKGENGLQSLQNCFWVIIITMMTVGYGDMYPKSHFGRAVGVAACVVGIGSARPSRVGVDKVELVTFVVAVGVATGRCVGAIRSCGDAFCHASARALAASNLDGR